MEACQSLKALSYPLAGAPKNYTMTVLDSSPASWRNDLTLCGPKGTPTMNVNFWVDGPGRNEPLERCKSLLGLRSE